MRMSDWSSDVCSSDLAVQRASRQIILGDHLAGVFDQYAQHVEFRAGQFDRIAVEAHAARGRLQFDIATTQRHLFDRTWLRAAQHGAQEYGRTSGREGVGKYG